MFYSIVASMYLSDVVIVGNKLIESIILVNCTERWCFTYF